MLTAVREAEHQLDRLPGGRSWTGPAGSRHQRPALRLWADGEGPAWLGL